MGRAEAGKNERVGRTLPHLRGRTPDTVTWPSKDDDAVQDTAFEVAPSQRTRRYLNDPLDAASVQPAGVRAFDAEAPVPDRGAGESLPEGKIVRVAATGAIANPYEYEYDRYVEPTLEKRKTPRRNPRR